jgi:hypothetical protein
MKTVCPLPPIWSDIYLSLKGAWQSAGAAGDEPPLPFILNGWIATDDFEKNKRWQDMIEWADRHGLRHLIPDLPDEQMYAVGEFSGFTPPVPGEQCHEPKAAPTDEDLSRYLGHLQSHWQEIVGAELAAHTRPIKFTGGKKRQLVVRADPSYLPAWGMWSCFTGEGDRRAFTEFRKRINEAIAPHGVDHVVFNVEGWKTEE